VRERVFKERKQREIISKFLHLLANLDSVTRLSISMATTPPSSRRNKPEVAPKPSPKPAHRGGLHSFITRSREDVSRVSYGREERGEGRNREGEGGRERRREGGRERAKGGVYSILYHYYTHSHA
jgi:hypothetical protein